MKDYTVIQRLVPITSFLASLSVYAYVVWAKKHRIAVMVGQWFLPHRPETQHWTKLFLAAIHFGKEDDTLGAAASRKPAGNGKASENRLSVVGDWLAPIIVWVLVISMGLAIVGFLLGER